MEAKCLVDGKGTACAKSEGEMHGVRFLEQQTSYEKE